MKFVAAFIVVAALMSAPGPASAGLLHIGHTHHHRHHHDQGDDAAPIAPSPAPTPSGPGAREGW